MNKWQLLLTSILRLEAAILFHSRQKLTRLSNVLQYEAAATRLMFFEKALSHMFENI
jgi:hypothetical protein